MDRLVEYVPIITSIFSAFFARQLLAHYQQRKTQYLLWWLIGVITFGMGTLSESVNILFGWSQLNVRVWYIVGALLGGFPLAQGSVYLLMNRKFANVTTVLMGAIILVAAICVILTPITVGPDFDQKLTGRVFDWQWVRLFSPFINIYAFIFLVGGALYSAFKYYARGDRQARFQGNILIAIGGLLPGIGGSFTRFGFVNALFVTELLGLVTIYAGYRIIRANKPVGARVASAGA